MRGRGTVRGATVEGSGYTVGQQHTGPLWLVATLILFGGAFFLGSLVQMTGTEQAVYNLMQSTYVAQPGMTAQQLLDIQNNSLSQTQLIATTIGWGVQIFMLMVAFPSEHYMAPGLARGRKFVMGMLLILDILTDATYVLAGHAVFAGIAFAPGGFGILLVAFFYPMALCGVTVFCGIEMAHRADRLIHHFI